MARAFSSLTPTFLLCVTMGYCLLGLYPKGLKVFNGDSHFIAYLKILSHMIMHIDSSSSKQAHIFLLIYFLITNNWINVLFAFFNKPRKRSVIIPFPKKGNAKDAQTSAQLHSSHTRGKQCSKFSNPGFRNM